MYPPFLWWFLTLKKLIIGICKLARIGIMNRFDYFLPPFQATGEVNKRNNDFKKFILFYAPQIPTSKSLIFKVFRY